MSTKYELIITDTITELYDENGKKIETTEEAMLRSLDGKKNIPEYYSYVLMTYTGSTILEVDKMYYADNRRGFIRPIGDLTHTWKKNGEPFEIQRMPRIPQSFADEITAELRQLKQADQAEQAEYEMG